MRKALQGLSRYIATSLVSKHFFFSWVPKDVLPANLVIVIARDDDYFFGVLHSRIHELWGRATGTQLREEESGLRYTPTTTFETFPFPWPPGDEPDLTGRRLKVPSMDRHPADLSGLEAVADIAHWARELVNWRDAWLNPPPPAKGTLDVAYDRLIKARTLTNLYNGLVYYRATSRNRVSGRNSVSSATFDRAEFDKETRKSVTPAEIQELDDIHRALDAAVLRAYGWPADLDDEAILERLLELNKSRGAGAQGSGGEV
jgi:hypothetical protein